MLHCGQHSWDHLRFRTSGNWLMRRCSPPVLTPLGRLGPERGSRRGRPSWSPAPGRTRIVLREDRLVLHAFGNKMEPWCVAHRVDSGPTGGHLTGGESAGHRAQHSVRPAALPGHAQRAAVAHDRSGGGVAVRLLGLSLQHSGRLSQFADEPAEVLQGGDASPIRTNTLLIASNATIKSKAGSWGRVATSSTSKRTFGLSAVAMAERNWATVSSDA
jgi:hypothetical protein